MKLKDILDKVDKSENFKSSVYIAEIAEDMDLEIQNYDNQDRLISYFIGNWYCTDSYVGYKVYFFDDEPVAISSQMGRKCDENIEWVSKEQYDKVRDYVLTFQEDEEPTITLCDMGEEIGEAYKIHYHDQLFGYHLTIPLYNGLTVSIIEKHKGSEHNKLNQYEPSLVKIQFEDKTEKWVELKELDFPYNTL